MCSRDQSCDHPDVSLCGIRVEHLRQHKAGRGDKERPEDLLYLFVLPECVEVIEELIKLAKELREADKRGEGLGLTEAELAFYEALEVNDSAGMILGDEFSRRSPMNW